MMAGRPRGPFLRKQQAIRSGMTGKRRHACRPCPCCTLTASTDRLTCCLTWRNGSWSTSAASRLLGDQFLVAMGRLATKVAIERRAEWIIIATRICAAALETAVSREPGSGGGGRAGGRHRDCAARRAAVHQSRPQAGCRTHHSADRTSSPAATGQNPRVASIRGDGSLPDRAAERGRGGGR